MSLGTLQCRPQVQQAIQYLRQYVGEGVKAELRWDRTGKQDFPLLAKGDWSAVALFGKFGHMQLSAFGSNLPIETVGFGYNVDRDDISIDIDRLTFKGLAKLIGPANPDHPQASGAIPSGFGPMSLLTIFSILKGIWSLMNPRCSLILGGNVTATAVLNGETITVEFQEMPSIHLVAFFRFELAVRRVVITDRSAKLEFSGSSLVKSREFDIQ